MRRRRLLLIAGGLGGLGLIGWNVKGSTMQEIRFELGRNIVETARRSGVPEFSVAKTSTLIDYSVNSIPRGIPARYIRPGYEIVWKPLYGFMMFANERYGSDLTVHYASLQLADSIRSHAEAQAFVEQTIAQFQQGRWQRYFHDELPRLTGRSSYLDEHDKIDAFSIDPNYKIPVEEWAAVAESRANWHWIGEGVLAELSVSFRVDSETKQPIYSMDLTFENEAIKNRYLAENKARELKEGDAKGWNSTARAAADKQFVIEQNKRLEQKAIERGDSVVPRT